MKTVFIVAFLSIVVTGLMILDLQCVADDAQDAQSLLIQVYERRIADLQRSLNTERIKSQKLQDQLSANQDLLEGLQSEKEGLQKLHRSCKRQLAQATQ